MPQVRAKEDCYLGEHGYRKQDEVFDYSGTKHDSLELVKKAPVSKLEEPLTPEEK